MILRAATGSEGAEPSTALAILNTIEFIHCLLLEFLQTHVLQNTVNQVCCTVVDARALENPILLLPCVSQATTSSPARVCSHFCTIPICSSRAKLAHNVVAGCTSDGCVSCHVIHVPPELQRFHHLQVLQPRPQTGPHRPRQWRLCLCRGDRRAGAGP